jgi:hypothetical protein
MQAKNHFISGVPRSGPTAVVTKPALSTDSAGSRVDAMLRTMGTPRASSSMRSASRKD